jgi:hypothetical protein
MNIRVYNLNRQYIGAIQIEHRDGQTVYRATADGHGLIREVKQNSPILDQQVIKELEEEINREVTE